MHFCEHLKVNSVSIFIHTVRQEFNWIDDNLLQKLLEHTPHVNNRTRVLIRHKEDLVLRNVNGANNIFPKQLHNHKMLKMKRFLMMVY
jgi:hypothetical protein